MGLVTPVRIRHVYSAELISIGLLDASGGDSGDDLTIRLPVALRTHLRRGDPPPSALHLFDPQAADGHTSMALGPCPISRRWTDRYLRDTTAVIAHIPILCRRDWLHSMVPGAICDGDFYLESDGRPT
ncbi:hypothetical protein [Aureliella helgolandensis]|uniref:Uncharacterized protein n=1 Tax=Aureliella helgolandensis TaxID=2527968 RepID=A0A518G447_9BACT|nr:hypothetical protein [Aureliella helgolandensis]QDV23368.1 hypothetical protein Q31a_16660 [Aureliella helgolandensis]